MVGPDNEVILGEFSDLAKLDEHTSSRSEQCEFEIERYKATESEIQSDHNKSFNGVHPLVFILSKNRLGFLVILFDHYSVLV